MSTSSTSPPSASSRPPSIASPTTTTTNAHSLPPQHSHHHIHPTLPSAETQRHVAEARAAVVASMGNMVDTELQSRAAVLHENARALDKQERDVVTATEGLQREREKLVKEADVASRRLKEVGHVQNWAEVLERQFLVLEETVRLANGEVSEGESSGSSCSCSECGEGRSDGDDDARRGNFRGKVDAKNEAEPKAKENSAFVDMTKIDTVGGDHTAWSDASRSLNEPESNTGTGMAKGSETASVSASS